MRRVFTSNHDEVGPIRPTCLSSCCAFSRTSQANCLMLECWMQQQVCDLSGKSCDFAPSHDSGYTRGSTYITIWVPSVLPSHIHPPRVPLVIVSLRKALSCWWGLIPGCLSLSGSVAPPPTLPQKTEQPTDSSTLPVIPSSTPSPNFLTFQLSTLRMAEWNGNFTFI